MISERFNAMESQMARLKAENRYLSAFVRDAVKSFSALSQGWGGTVGAAAQGRDAIIATASRLYKLDLRSGDHFQVTDLRNLRSVCFAGTKEYQKCLIVSREGNVLAQFFPCSCVSFHFLWKRAFSVAGKFFERQYPLKAQST